MAKKRKSAQAEKLTKAIIRGMQEKKATEIVLMDLREARNAVADFFVICSVFWLLVNEFKSQLRFFRQCIFDIVYFECQMMQSFAPFLDEVGDGDQRKPPGNQCINRQQRIGDGHAQGRRVREGEQVVIGGNESYRAVCPSCFYADELAGPDRAPGLFG